MFLLLSLRSSEVLDALKECLSVFLKEQKIVATEGRRNYYTLYIINTLYINIIGWFSLPTCVE